MCKHILLITFLNESELIFLTQLNGFKYCYICHSLTSVICLSVILFLNDLQLIRLHTSIAIISSQLSDFNYCNLTLIIQFNITHSFTQLNSSKYYYYTNNSV